MSLRTEIIGVARKKRQKLLKEYKDFTGRKILFIIICLLILLFTSGISATIGSFSITVLEVYSIIWNGIISSPQETAELVVWNIRLPRIIMSIIAGIGLASAGAAMQGMLRNPLASPFTLGISAGAAFGAALAILLGAGLVGGKYLIISNAFVFSLIPTMVVIGLTRQRRATPGTMLLAGIALQYIFSAITTVMMYFSDADAMREAYFWTVGSLDRANWEFVLPSLLILTVCLIPIYWKSVDMNVISAGDESAKSLGVNVETTRIFILALSTLMTAGIICFTGTIGFIGLVSPHICRMVIGGDNRYLLPASGVLGGVLLMAADIISRTIIAPSILPVGAVTAFMGGPLFLYLIIRRRKEYW